MDTARAREAETFELKESLEEKVVELDDARNEVLFERNKLKSIIECMQEGVVFVDSGKLCIPFQQSGATD